MGFFDLFKTGTFLKSKSLLDKRKKKEVIGRMHMKLINSSCPGEREIWEKAIENTYGLGFEESRSIEKKAIVSQNLLVQRLEKDKEARIKFEEERIKFEKSQRKKGLELFDGKLVNKREIPKLQEIKVGLDKNFQNLSSYEFEKFIAKLFRAMGYKTKVTQASNDYGIDVIAEKGSEKIAIQCKRYQPKNPVSNRDIQRLLGAMQLKSVRATHSIIITTSHFTVQAREQAKECAIELWDSRDLEKIVKKYLMNL